MSDARSNIAIKLEAFEDKEFMQEKEHAAMYVAACATTLSLPSDINKAGRIIIADSSFGSVTLAKKAHMQFPQESLDLHHLHENGLHILLIWMVLNYRQ